MEHYQGQEEGALVVYTSQGRLEISVSVSKADGAVVVEIDTPDWEDGHDAPDMGPQLRIWLNDFLMHQGVELPTFSLDS